MKFFKLAIRFILDIITSRYVLSQLIKRDFKSRYLGSYLGLFWAFAQPLVTIGVLWFVFELGFKAAPESGNIPFILWLSTGMIPWFFICEALGSATNSVIEHSYLVKKIAFRVGLLPIVKIASASIIHFFLAGLIMFMLIIYGIKPNLYNLQFFYYYISAVAFLLGLSWFTSSVVIFFKDLNQIVQVIIQVGFWGTPIFWKTSHLAPNLQWVFKLNPAYYITEGFRFTFIYNVPFWHHWLWGLYFWCITFAMMIIGTFVFNKLKPHFADAI